MYMKTHNQGLSLTAGRDLFDPDALAYDAADVNLPLNWVQIRAGIPRSLKQLAPTDTLYSKTREPFLTWSETIWVKVGQVMDAEPAPALGGGLGSFFTPEHFRVAMEPLVPKEKVFSSTGRLTSRYRLLLAALALSLAEEEPLTT
jgi:phage repressor protein C with HTH and peptisase S24 domain